MSADGELYRVLYRDRDGHEQLTGAMPYDAAYSRAQDLDGQGFAVGSVLTANAAVEYMQDRYSPTYRGVKVPDGMRDDGQPRSVYEAWKRGVDAELEGEQPKPARDPFAPDLTMSHDVADFTLRAVTGLLHEGYWPKSYRVDGGRDEEDGFDADVVLKAADIIGRDNIKNTDLQRFIAELDSDDGGAT